MDKKTLNAYWTFARWMSKIDPKEVDTPQAKQLCNDYYALHNAYLALMDEVNKTSGEDDAEKMDFNECMEMMLSIVQDYITKHSDSPKMTRKAALAWKTLMQAAMPDEQKEA